MAGVEAGKGTHAQDASSEVHNKLAGLIAALSLAEVRRSPWKCKATPGI